MLQYGKPRDKHDDHNEPKYIQILKNDDHKKHLKIGWAEVFERQMW